MPGSDNDTKISELKEQVKEFNTARSWKQFHTPKEVAISISIEAAELLDFFQWKALSRSDIERDPEKLFQIQEEIADIIYFQPSKHTGSRRQQCGFGEAREEC